MHELLIVDDHSHLIESLEQSIPWKQLGIGAVHKAFSGEEALEFYKSHPVDILITDIRMPGISGLELIEQVKKFDKRVKCMLISGFGEWEYAKEAIKHQVDDYLLKPIDHQEFIDILKRLIDTIRQEWDERGKQHKAMKMLNEHMPLFREKLLIDLLQGKKISYNLLQEKLKYYHLSFQPEDEVAICLIRIESTFDENDFYSRSLIASAITNIAEETLSDLFDVWNGNDAYDYSIFVIKVKENSWMQLEPDPDKTKQQSFEHLASKIQHNVKLFIKRDISILVGGWGSLQADIRRLYQDSLSVFSRHLVGDNALFISLNDNAKMNTPERILTLYESPTLIQLFEVGQWDAIRNKLNAVFQELTDKKMESKEILLELYFQVMGAFSYYAHKNGLNLQDIVQVDLEKIGDANRMRNLRHLQEWACTSLDNLQSINKNNWQNEQNTLILRIQQYISLNIAHATLQSVADYVGLHPVYLSALFKSKTLENISDFIFKARMQKARGLLVENASYKVIDVGEAVGYHKPQYFNKLFKDHFGVTPQEYRDKSQSH